MLRLRKIKATQSRNFNVAPKTQTKCSEWSIQSKKKGSASASEKLTKFYSTKAGKESKMQALEKRSETMAQLKKEKTAEDARLLASS